MYYIYIVQCSDKTYYSGYTKNLKRRVDEHNNSKKGAKYTSARRPVKLVYSEKFDSLSDALKREYEIKGMTRERKINLVKKSGTN